MPLLEIQRDSAGQPVEHETLGHILTKPVPLEGEMPAQDTQVGEFYFQVTTYTYEGFALLSEGAQGVIARLKDYVDAGEIQGPFYVDLCKLNNRITPSIILFAAEDAAKFKAAFPDWDDEEELRLDNIKDLRQLVGVGWVPSCPRLRQFCEENGYRPDRPSPEGAAPTGP